MIKHRFSDLFLEIIFKENVLEILKILEGVRKHPYENISQKSSWMLNPGKLDTVEFVQASVWL